ncbi:MAG: hypothetical protein WCW47_00570 [Candidatus Paceibacterota bacterium]|jgi:hypothetical protein
MKKKIVQDVIPPKKTIRNVELLYRAKRSEKIPKEVVKQNIPVIPEVSESNSTSNTETFSETENFSYKYEYDEPVRHSKKILYVSVVLFVLALSFGISALFKSAEIRIIPRSEISSIDENFKALKNLSTNGLGFQTVTTTKDIEKTVSATDEEQVEKKAIGKIVVYNNYSVQPQALVKTTRFETPDGLVFRTVEDITVPGIQIKSDKAVAGSIEVGVEADKPGPKYNIGLKDFSIAGFKGTPKYTKIYGRSRTEMSGGFVGTQKTVSKETINKIDEEIKELLKTSLSKDIISQIPENFVLYQNSTSFKFEPITQINVTTEESGTTNTIILKKKGSISAIIFDKGSLSRAIVSKILPDVASDIIKITNLESLNFTFQSETQFNPNTDTFLNFNLKGEANFQWVFDENKLKFELLGMSKNNAITIISKYDTIKEAKIETHPFWNKTIPKDSNKVTLINTLAK